MDEFAKFPKIPRLFRDCVITEKIDGTNAQIVVLDSGAVLAGSRSRWLSTGKGNDNFGFAAWVEEHRDELVALGPGRHYGEWWGQGIQRTYDLDHKRFSLFNTGRWLNPRLEFDSYTPDAVHPPPCCDVVPVLYAGEFSTHAVREAAAALRLGGSLAAYDVTGVPYMDAEGVIVFHSAASQMFKVTLDDDAVPKALAKAMPLPRTEHTTILAAA